MVTLSSSDRIDLNDIPPTLRKRLNQPNPNWMILSGEITLEQAVERLERQMISEALRRCNYVQTRAAQMLGISRRQLKYKMDALGLTDPKNGSKKDDEE